MINKVTGFHIQSTDLPDDRMRFDTLADANAMPALRKPVGLLAYIEGEDAFYYYNGDTYVLLEQGGDFHVEGTIGVGEWSPIGTLERYTHQIDVSTLVSDPKDLKKGCLSLYEGDVMIDAQKIEYKGNKITITSNTAIALSYTIN